MHPFHENIYQAFQDHARVSNETKAWNGNLIAEVFARLRIGRNNPDTALTRFFLAGTEPRPCKARDSLLSLEHPVGRGKRGLALGFSRGEWSTLQRALLSVATQSEAILLAASPYGQKYEARAIFKGSTGQAAEVVTIWIILAGEDFPRLVTAYPGDAQ